MNDRTNYFRRRNRRTPVMPIRMPSPQHYDQVRAAAKEVGSSVSAWVREAIHEKMERQHVEMINN